MTLPQAQSPSTTGLLTTVEHTPDLRVERASMSASESGKGRFEREIRTEAEHVCRHVIFPPVSCGPVVAGLADRVGQHALSFGLVFDSSKLREMSEDGAVSQSGGHSRRTKSRQEYLRRRGGRRGLSSRSSLIRRTISRQSPTTQFPPVWNIRRTRNEVDVWLDPVVPELDERRRLEDERSRIEDPLLNDHRALLVLSGA